MSFSYVVKGGYILMSEGCPEATSEGVDGIKYSTSGDTLNILTDDNTLEVYKLHEE